MYDYRNRNDMQRLAVINADTMVIAYGLPVLKFHPLHKRVKDGTPRCISCGQIDEPDIHEAAYCPGMGGRLPFATSTFKFTLKADSGYKCEGSTRLTIEQWIDFNRWLASKPCRAMVAGDIYPA